ncbi:hypothetical protein [Fervidibacter sacchari]
MRLIFTVKPFKQIFDATFERRKLYQQVTEEVRQRIEWMMRR